jgi:hypothetical protein
MLMLDTVISITLHYWGGADTQFLITALQPIFALIILSYTVDGTIWNSKEPKG